MTTTSTARPDPVLLDIDQTAELLTIPAGTLRYWRHLGQGPQGFKIGRFVRWDRDEVLAWLDAQRELPAREGIW